MREIKYRVANTEHGIIGYWTPNDPAQLPPQNGDWQQYTGLKDKNSIEIYGGDIISGSYNYGLYGAEILKEFIGTVEWRDEPSLDGGFGGWYLAPNPTQVNTQPPISATSRAEVIGNIYENPELLK